MKTLTQYNEQAQRIMSDIRLAVDRARDDVDQIDEDVELTNVTYHYGEGKPIHQRATAQETVEEVAISKIKQALLDMLTQANLIVAQTRQRANNETYLTKKTASAIEKDIEITKIVTENSQ
jgi:hypothetical protein